MKISPIVWKFLSLILLSLVIWGFFYFEVSLFLRIMAILLGLLGLLTISSMGEILSLVILYLGLYDLYNIRYSLAIPLALIITIVFFLSMLVFYLETRFNKMAQNLAKNLFLLYLLTTGLIVMEIFLTMSFWPVDPKIKSLVIVIVFYLVLRIFYLYINNVLNLKKIVTLILICALVLGIVVAFNMWFGF